MQLLSALFLALSASSDAFIVGLSYGTKKISINFANNIVVSFIAGLGTLLAMLFGGILNTLIPSPFENILGSLVLILFGLYMLWGITKKKQSEIFASPKDTRLPQLQYYETALRNPEIIDINRSKTIELKEALVLGGVLCINNVGLGMGASIAGLNPYITSISSFMFSILFLQLGYYTGSKFLSHKLARYSDVVSACLIIALGLYELFL
jgi:putative sporulation protein YtaF